MSRSRRTRFQKTMLYSACLTLALTSVVDAGPADSKAQALGLSAAHTLRSEGARNPTAAVDKHTGTVYLSWAQEQAVSAPNKDPKKKRDPILQVMLARSDDGGKTFASPVVVNPVHDHVVSYTVSPTRVAAGGKGEVYVLYEVTDPSFKPGGWQYGKAALHLAVSHDGGRHFDKPVGVGSSEVEHALNVIEMLNLFVAPNGDLYASFLDYREGIAYRLKHKREPKREEEPPTQLRVAKSIDGGKHFRPSSLVAKWTCGCCGTQVTQGTSGPLYAATRAAWREHKGAHDEVRDIFVSTSYDGGRQWSAPVKIHDDQFKISACPDVTPGLAVDSKGRLHAAWYTGSDRHPGVFYARSDNEAKTFSEPVKLLGDEWVPYGDVKLALDSNDNAWVVYEDKRADDDVLQLARISPDGKLSHSQTWLGTAPDITVVQDRALITYGTQAKEGEEHGGGVHVRFGTLEAGS